jgi:ribosomal protein L3 glutamine methyltransferase
MTRAARETFQTIRDLIRFGVTTFNEAKVAYGHGTDNAYDEAVYLTLSTLSLPLDKLEPFLDARLTAAEINSLIQVFERRVANRLPAPYLTHEAWHLGYRFYVDERVIIPRSFIGELLADRLAPWVEDPDAELSVLDLCTGSGAIAIQAAHAFPNAKIDAIDLSMDALKVAARNVADYGLSERVRLIQSDLFGQLSRERYDLILSNPPYVNAESMQRLPPEFQHEPAMALAGGKDGMDLVRKILRGARSHLNSGGQLVLEIGHERRHFEAAFPDMSVTWLSTSAGDDAVLHIAQDRLP